MNRLTSVLTVSVLSTTLAFSAPRSENRSLQSSDNAVNDSFSRAVDIDGALMVMGAPGADIGAVTDQGAVYVFQSDGHGGWTQLKKIIAPDGAAFDQLGLDVAISGETVVAGAKGAAVGSNSSQGAAYVFERNSGGIDNWGMVTKLVAASDIGNLADYGASTDIEGDTIIVGAPNAFDSAEGAVYIYSRNLGGPNAWGQVVRLIDDVSDSNASFGTDVALFGNVVVIGCELLDKVAGSFNNEGAAYVFTRDAGGVWSKSTLLRGSDAIGNGHFGVAVAINETRLVIGATSMNPGGLSGAGEAYVFDKTGPNPGDWTQSQILSASDKATFAYFGKGVRVLGDTIIVGASSSQGKGKAYHFERNGTWTETETLIASNAASGDGVGDAVGIAPGVVLLGAPYVGLGIAYQYDMPLPNVGPGRIAGSTLKVAKAAGASRLRLSWGASCSSGASDYGIYEGQIGNWYSHSSVVCTDIGADRSEEITYALGNRYYLVVPRSATEEGSYGTASNAVERPVGSSRCAPSQVIRSCP